MDGNESIYHTLWPRNSTLKKFADTYVYSFERPHSTYIIFGRYDKHSIKYHERQRVSISSVCTEQQYNTTSKDIMKSDVNKHLCDANRMNPQLQLIGDECEYHHEEAVVNIVSYLLSCHHKESHSNSR